MTKSEFINQVPAIIQHHWYGPGELEIIIDSDDQKGVCYRHKEKVSSFASFAKNWDALYLKFAEILFQNGYMDKK
jgi:hypothetical protein